VRGVEESVPGFSGGSAKDANYNRVSTGKTGHAEVVNIKYNPDVISYRQLLEMFFGSHDPTTLNRQDPDVGPQYRSVIFYHNATQKSQAEQYISELKAAKKFKNPIVTQVVPFTTFYKAERYHIRYYRNHPQESYIKYVTKPQVEKFKTDFRKYLKTPN
jgi:peptide-methionine (S)-S-oxide reductase